MIPACLAQLMVVVLASASYIVTDWLHSPIPGSGVNWPSPRTGAAMWQDENGDAWLFGGLSAEPREEFFGDLWVFRSRERAWQQLTPLPGQGRRDAAMCVLPSHILIVVGGTEKDDALSDETVIFDLQRDVWGYLTCSTTNSTAADLSTCRHCNMKLNVTNSCEVCNNVFNWTSTVCPPFRRKPLVWCTKETLWMVGGRDRNYGKLEDAWQLHVGTDNIEWRHAPEASLPPSFSDVVHWSVGNSQPVVLTTSPEHNNQSVVAYQQLWIFKNGQWQLLDSSGRNIEIQWPSERTQASTWIDSFGNLWLYGGLAVTSLKSQNFFKDYEDFNESINVLSQPWMYSVSANVWVKPEVRLPGPGPRTHAFAWTQRFHGFLFGGRTNCSHWLCIANDLWELNVTYTNQHMTRYRPIPASRNLPLESSRRPANSSSAALIPFNSSTKELGSSKEQKDAGKARSPWHEQHSDVFGSAIFFGISLSFFAVFGLVIFCQRCVSCPPRRNVLLKDPPPVRYTVIPNEIYIA